MRVITLALGLLAAAQVAVADGQTPDALGNQSLISKFLNNSAEPPTQYRAVRYLEARNQRFKKHGWTDVRTEVTTSSYSIGGEEPVGPGFVRLTVKPLRKEITLVDGAVFVTDTDTDLVRIEGMETS